MPGRERSMAARGSPVPARRRGLWIAAGVMGLAGAAVIVAAATHGTAAHRPTLSAPPPMSFDPAHVRLRHRPRVEVLNASGTSGLARDVTQRLRGLGFDVVYYGNGKNFDRNHSIVLARSPDTTAAHRVAEALGISRVESKPDSDLLLDVSVVLGSDWKPPPGRRGVSWPVRLWRRLTHHH